MKKILCNGKKIKPNEEWLIEKSGNHGKLRVCYDCPHSNCETGQCSSCYGVVISVTMDEFIKNKELEDFSEVTSIYRDKFIIESGKIIDILPASKFMEDILIMSKTIGGFGTSKETNVSPWVYTDKPYDWKTACLKCREKYGKITPCKDIEKNRENGKLDNFCEEQKSKVMNLY